MLRSALILLKKHLTLHGNFWTFSGCMYYYYYSFHLFAQVAHDSGGVLE